MTGAVLIFDGLFLHRSELIAQWDLTVFLIADGRRQTAWETYLSHDLPNEETARRLEIAARTAAGRRLRYIGGQALYEDECEPLRRAHVLIDNDDLRHPRILRRQSR